MSAAQTLQMTQLVSLAEVLAGAPAQHQLRPGFRARLAGPLVGGDVAEEAEVRTVLERTAVVDLGGRGRRLARIPDVLVEREAMTWVPVAPTRTRLWAHGPPGDEAVSGELADQRASSDERARDDQERHQRELDDERRRRRAKAATAAAPLLDETVGDDVVDAEEDGASVERAAAPVSSPQLGEWEHEEAVASVAQRAESDGNTAGPADVAVGAPVGRQCGRCNRPLGARNRQGLCAVCQTTCPDCGGQKAPAAKKCWRCAGTGRHGERAAEVVVEPESGSDVVTAGDRTALEAAREDPARDPTADADGEAEDLKEVPHGRQADAVPIPEPTLELRDSAAEPSGEAAEPIGDVEPAADDQAGPESARRCRRCDRELPGQNRKGLCTPCQAICPTCGGSKAVQAARCRACGREEPPGPASAGLSFAAAMESLPEMVRELREQLIEVSDYARGLEDELVAYRAAELRRSRVR